jgi:hypothetical protein
VHQHVLPTEPQEDAALLPPGAGLALIGSAMMIVGAFGPWIGGRFFGAMAGIDLGGDGWLVLGASLLALVSLLLPQASPLFRGTWVVAFAAGAGYVCWAHYNEAHADGVEVVWGLELAGIGCVLLGFAGLQLVLTRSRS